MSEISELTKALQETTKELKAQRESIESLKKSFFRVRYWVLFSGSGR